MEFQSEFSGLTHDQQQKQNDLLEQDLQRQRLQILHQRQQILHQIQQLQLILHQEQPPVEEVAVTLPIKVQNIDYSGLNNTKLDIIEKILSPIKKCQEFREFEKVNSSIIHQLKDLSIFSEVDLHVVPSDDTKEKAWDVKLKVKEKKRETLSVFTSIDANRNPRGTVTTGYNNLFGRCEKLSFQAGTDSLDSNLTDMQLSVAFEKPFLLWDKPGQSFTLGLDRSKINHEHTNCFEQKDFRFDAAYINKTNHETSSTLNRWSYGLVHRRITCNKNANEKIQLEGGPHVKSSVSNLWRYTTQRDESSAGATAQLETEIAGFGGDVYHFKQTTGLLATVPLGRSLAYLQLGLRTGLHVPIFGRSFISDRFFLGGLDSFRGFDFRGVGPRATSRCFNKPTVGNYLGGDIFYLASADVSVPVQSNFRFHLFSQLGSVSSYQKEQSFKQHWNSISDIEKMRVIVGAGILWKIQDNIGIELNFNCPIQRQKTDSFLELQLGIGGELL